jgi:AcrR family transcriptional regulator
MASADPKEPVENERKSDRTRERILAAARNAFARKGFSSVTIKDITGPADVARANFYYYFQDKTQLFIELGTATYLEVLAVVESFSDLRNPVERRQIRDWVDRYFEYLDRNGAFVIRSSEDAPADRQFREAVARSHRRTAQSLGDRIAKVAATTPEADSHAMGLTVMAMVERTWFMQRYDESSPADKAAKAALCEVLFRLLA